MKHSKAWEWSDLTSDDVSLVADFIAATEAFDDAPIRTPFSEVASYFGTECPWKAQGAWAGDTLVAFGLARIISNTQWETTITLSGSVHPQWRAQGVGTDLLERQVEVAHALAGARLRVRCCMLKRITRIWLRWRKVSVFRAWHRLFRLGERRRRGSPLRLSLTILRSNRWVMV